MFLDHMKLNVSFLIFTLSAAVRAATATWRLVSLVRYPSTSLDHLEDEGQYEILKRYFNSQNVLLLTYVITSVDFSLIFLLILAKSSVLVTIVTKVADCCYSSGNTPARVLFK